MSPPVPQYLTDASAFHALCERLRGCARFALDTEFVGEDTFVPKLELVQIACNGTCVIVDVPAVGSLEPLGEALADPRIEKVVHAGRQDLELLALHTGRAPVSIFDTQLAAAMVGYGTQIGYAPLVHRILGTKLAKGHTLTNWNRRPLTREQLAYAAEDVQYLLPMHDHLVMRLRALGRIGWIREEFARLEAKLGEGARDPRLGYQRIRGWESLRPAALVVLRELALWRDEQARQRNVPRGRVIRDEVLLELARHAPTSPEALRHQRGLHASEIERNGETLVKLIQAALSLPKADWPQPPPPKLPSEATGLVDLLQAVLKTRAKEAHIAPSLLATSSDLHALVEAQQSRVQPDLPILQGWRRQLAGETLLKVLAGQASVCVDPKTGALKLSPAP
ncbi:ribonuclease D [Nitrospira sp. Kam-Ns4a]